MSDVSRRDIEALFALPWEELQPAAWGVRKTHHPDVLAFGVPGTKRYGTEHYHNTPHRFAAVSLTGRECRLKCEHCRGHLLETMWPVSSPSALVALAKRLMAQGCAGVLVSGGADESGAVPLGPYLPVLAWLKEQGLRVIVHTGLPDRKTVEGLRAAGVDQVLLDVVGDEETIREVFHLNRSPEDYAEALALLREQGIPVAPHIIVGLHFGQLRGEFAALELVRRVGADVVVFVVLRPLPGTPMAHLPPVAPDVVGRLIAVARLIYPTVPITLGCARPAGPVKGEMERMAVLAGVNGVAYPDPATVLLAERVGLRGVFAETCCTLAVFV